LAVIVFAIPQYNPGTLADAGFRSLKRFSEKTRQISNHSRKAGKQMVNGSPFHPQFQGFEPDPPEPSGGGAALPRHNSWMPGSRQNEMLANEGFPH
jgi:hypothetical protein